MHPLLLLFVFALLVSRFGAAPIVLPVLALMALPFMLPPEGFSFHDTPLWTAFVFPVPFALLFVAGVSRTRSLCRPALLLVFPSAMIVLTAVLARGAFPVP